METIKLYDSQPELMEFQAVVAECCQVKKGYEVVLDRTAFYPEGGGQPCDHGTLNGIAVTDVQEKGGQVVHTLAQPLEPGAAVTGRVDSARRADLCQQHTADHILCGLIHAAYGFENVGFHIGEEVVTIDLDGVLSWEQLEELETRANEVIWQDLPVTVSYPAAEELAAMTYRSKKELSGAVRIVTIPGVDVCACCGTHVPSTGRVGAIKVLSLCSWKGGVRMEIAAGRRALEWTRLWQGQVKKISALLSAKPGETAAAVERLLGERDGMKARLAAAADRQIAEKAKELAGAGTVVLFEEDLDAEGVRKLAAGVMETCGGLCAVFSGSEAEGYKYALGQKDGDLRAFVKEMNAALSGRGGGRDAFFVQGSVKAGEAAIRAFFEGK